MGNERTNKFGECLWNSTVAIAKKHELFWCSRERKRERDTEGMRKKKKGTVRKRNEGGSTQKKKKRGGFRKKKIERVNKELEESEASKF